MRASYVVTVLLLTWAISPGGAAAMSRENAEHLVVHIRSVAPSGEEEFGAGVVFRVEMPFVYIVTANHVVRSGPDEHEGLRVRFESWPGESFAAKALDNRSLDLDLAVLRVDLSGAAIPADLLPDPATIGGFIPSRELERGQAVFPIGHPQGHEWLVPGQSSALQSIGALEIEFDSACEAGHSGGGLFDENWHLVGMMRETDGSVCIAIHFEAVIAELEKWRYHVDLRPVEDSSSFAAGSSPPLPPPITPTTTGRYPCEGTVVRPGIKLRAVRAIPAQNAPLIAIMGGTSVTIKHRCTADRFVWYLIDYELNDLEMAWIPEDHILVGPFCPLENIERIEEC